VLNRQINESLGQGLEVEAVVDGCLQSRSMLWGDALTLVGAVFPDLVFEVGAGLGAGGAGTILGLEAAQFHRVQAAHLLEEGRAFCEKGVVHGAIMSSN
jgi:hypothetical protein